MEKAQVAAGAGSPSVETRVRSMGRSRRLGEQDDQQRPLLRPAARATMFFPLVVVAAVMPGLYALNWWDITPPGPWWGLRGLAVQDGFFLDQLPISARWPAGEAWGFRSIALQPPLYAWLEGAGFWLSPTRNPLISVLPSYAAGALIVILVYWHGRVWFGPGLGLTAAVLTAFNRQLLIQMQQATPVTVGLAGILLALFAYSQHLRSGTSRGWPWILVGGLAIALSLMSVGLVALLCVPIVLLHQAILGAEASVGGWQPSRWWRSVRNHSSIPGGILTLLLAVAIASPWYVLMASRYGADFVSVLVSPPESGWDQLTPNLLLILLTLTPTTLPLGLYAAVRTVRQVLTAEGDDPAMVGGSFWLAWLAVAALAPTVWSSGPQTVMALLLLVPMNLLAARAMVELATRRIPARTLVWLAPATALSIAWWLSSSLRDAVTEISFWRVPDSGTLLGLHIGVDLILILALATRRLDRWARRRDQRRRVILTGFLLTVLGINAAAGIREVRFRHLETTELLDLRTEILRRNRFQRLETLAVVSPDPATSSNAGMVGTPGGRLRFLVRTALPDVPLQDFNETQALLSLPEKPRLVILVGQDQQLTYSAQSQLKLEMLHPGRSGMLTAYASSYTPPARKAR